MSVTHWKRMLGAAIVVAIATSCGGGGGNGTSIMPDQVAPTVESVQVTRAQQTDKVIVRARVFDDQSGVSAVRVRGITGQQETLTVQMQREFGDQYVAELPFNTLRIRVTAQDAAGNLRESDEHLVPPPNPPAL